MCSLIINQGAHAHYGDDNNNDHNDIFWHNDDNEWWQWQLWPDDDDDGYRMIIMTKWWHRKMQITKESKDYQRKVEKIVIWGNSMFWKLK